MLQPQKLQKETKKQTYDALAIQAIESISLLFFTEDNQGYLTA